MPPLVSVICLCYNHKRFVRYALQSVIDQTHSPIQLIVIDDCSVDGSVDVIEAFVVEHPEVTFLRLPANQGNCRAFNQGLKVAKGTYVIDLSADDVLMPSRVKRGVAGMEGSQACGVQFSDAELMDENGKTRGFHSDKFPHATIPSGKIFPDVLARYFINSPTMMIRKSLLDELGGYDETLAYEDFDFWVRSTPRTEYQYIPEPLVKRRILAASMGKQQRSGDGPQQRSTFLVCKKALVLCSNEKEFEALKKRLRYELGQALRGGAWSLAWEFWKLGRQLP